MAIYPVGETILGQIKIEITCYTGPDADAQIRRYLNIHISIGLLIGLVIGLTFSWLVHLIWWVLEYLSVSRSLLIKIIRFRELLLAHPLPTIVIIVLLGILIAALLWFIFVRRNYCNCPPERRGICIVNYYWRILGFIWMPYHSRSDPQYCNNIPPGCP